VSASIVIVDDEPDIAELFRQRFAAKPAKVPTLYTSPPRARRLWRSSAVRSSLV